MSTLDTLYEELTDRFKELKTQDSLENILRRAELGFVISRVQDLLIEELQKQVAQLEKLK